MIVMMPIGYGSHTSGNIYLDSFQCIIYFYLLLICINMMLQSKSPFIPFNFVVDLYNNWKIATNIKRLKRNKDVKNDLDMKIANEILNNKE
jgi:hypothetical protein